MTNAKSRRKTVITIVTIIAILMVVVGALFVTFASTDRPRGECYVTETLGANLKSEKGQICP
jgi:flagellar basal body-associated protein FliL